MNTEDDQRVDPAEPDDHVVTPDRNAKRPTLIIVAIFYAILFCLVITGFIIALSLTN